MRCYLIRHAQAGNPQPGRHDMYRTLTESGERRAAELAELLSPAGIGKVLTSPATRCWQTVAPLAEACGLDPEEQPDLFEGTPGDHVLSLLLSQDSPTMAVCSHGDVIPEVIERVAAAGAPITGRGCDKGSIWVVEHDGTNWTGARYLDRDQVQLPST